VVLMGGAAEVDPAARSFVEAAQGGDVLVLRATGSTSSYNPYFLSDLAPQPAPSSVTTIRIDDADSSASSAVLCLVDAAEAIWLAGGDQWDYVGHWTSALHMAVDEAANDGVPIGGTSAGAVVLGEAVFDARNGSVTSAEALANPLRADVSVSLSPLAQPELAGWTVDSHFSERDREGRLLVFLARMLTVTGRDTVYGVGLDERASIVLEGDTFAVMTGTSGRSAWIYRLIGPVTLASGEPLDLETVLRVELATGASGAWPPSFVGADTLRVVDGVVENGM
jgi:cyanophycinase-like exopeptidase